MWWGKGSRVLVGGLCPWGAGNKGNHVNHILSVRREAWIRHCFHDAMSGLEGEGANGRQVTCRRGESAIPGNKGHTREMDVALPWSMTAIKCGL